MKNLYVWMFLLFVYVILYVFVPVIFSMKSDVAVVAAVLILAAVPFFTYKYLKFFKIIKGETK